MKRLSFDRSTIAQTTAITLATIAATALFALVATYWTWEWLAPRPEMRAQTVADAGVHAVSDNGLFGNLTHDRKSASPTGIEIKLLGVVAATPGRRGYALIQLDPKNILAIREGEEIAPGIRLAEVAADHLTLERSGIRETLGWPIKNASAESAVPRINK
jgi:general secretion pathway protein C